MAGCLSSHLPYWETHLKNDRIVEWIRNGVPIESTFSSEPEPFDCLNRRFNKKECEFIDREVQNLLSAKCIKKCENLDPTDKYISPINVIPKRDSFRLVTDLRLLNKHCSAPKFRYEDLDDVIQTLLPTDLMVTFDVKNGFFHIPVRDCDTKYFCFRWKKTLYEWRVLPFGANVSPYYFCKVIRALVGYFRENDIRLVSYVDDFIVGASPDKIQVDRDFILNELSQFGFLGNLKNLCLLLPIK